MGQSAPLVNGYFAPVAIGKQKPRRSFEGRGLYHDFRDATVPCSLAHIWIPVVPVLENAIESEFR